MLDPVMEICLGMSTRWLTGLKLCLVVLQPIHIASDPRLRIPTHYQASS